MRKRLLTAALAAAAVFASSCHDEGDGAPAAPPPAACSADYPAAPYYPIAPHGPLSRYSLAGIGADGSAKMIDVASYRTPCDAPSSVLVVRVVAGWCGPCRWHASHLAALVPPDVASRVRVLDVVVRNDDGDPPDPSYALAWQASQDVHTDVALDGDLAVSDVLPPRGALPLYLLVDTRTMSVLSALATPAPEALGDALRAALAAEDGAPAPAPTPVTKVDGRFTRDRWDMIAAMANDAPPPPDPTDAKADDPAAAALGKSLFSDAGLSSSGGVACATCHRAPLGFTDGSPVSHDGLGPGDRNAPTIAFAGYGRWQFWDGRADTPWAQALGPIENPAEMASSRLSVAHAIADRYAASWVPVFGQLPDLSDTARFPPSGMPGDPAWEGMAKSDQDAIDRVFAGVGKALEAYERTLRPAPLPLDAYAHGDMGALASAQKDGLLAFFDAGCASCHWGPRLTDDGFHTLRLPTGRHDGQPDPGRMAGIELFDHSEFRADGAFSDAPGASGRAAPKVWDWTLGAFKTPALRGVASTAPYGHGGTSATLADVVEMHRVGGLDESDQRAAGITDRWLPPFDAATGAAILPFLETLTLDVQP